MGHLPHSWLVATAQEYTSHPWGTALKADLPLSSPLGLQSNREALKNLSFPLVLERLCFSVISATASLAESQGHLSYIVIRPALLL